MEARLAADGSARVRCTARADGDLAVGLDQGVLVARRAAIMDRPWFWLRQVHGDEVVVVDPAGGSGPSSAPGVAADAAVTRSADWVLAVHTADCAPVALVGEHGVIGAVHAGWRGLEAGVIERTVEVMHSSGAGRITARLGPCIHAECYAFGESDLAGLIERFGPEVAGETGEGELALDVPGAVRAALRSAGVDDLAVDPVCTGCDERYYSYRARHDTGRQAMLVWLDRHG